RSDNRIVLAGSQYAPDNDEEFHVMVLGPNGALEWRSGLPFSEPGRSWTRATTVAVDGDGSIVVGGMLAYDDTSYNGIIARYPAPKSTTPFMYFKTPDRTLLNDDIALQSDGKVLFATDSTLTRLTYNLAYDST